MKIKHMFEIVLLLTIVLIGFFVYIKIETGDDDNVKKEDFKTYELEFNRRLDSVDNCLKDIKADTDTLKKGQKVIFKAVTHKEVTSTTLWDFFN